MKKERRTISKMYYQSFDASEYLEHYGVKGMKWGVVRSKYKSMRERGLDKRNYKRSKRNLAAAKRNVKEKGKMLDTSLDKVDEAEKTYKKALSKTTLPWNKQKKYDAINAALKDVEKAHTDAEGYQKNFKRAERIHKEAASKYAENTNYMIGKYGSKSAKSLSVKNMKAGKRYIGEVYKTGITLADIPVFGNMYVGKFVSREETRIRNDLRTKKARKNEKRTY